MERRPSLPFEYQLYLRMFRTLNRDRQLGGMGGFGYIPLTSFESYCNLFRITNESDRQHLLSVVHLMDDAFVQYHADKQKAAA